MSISTQCLFTGSRSQPCWVAPTTTTLPQELNGLRLASVAAPLEECWGLFHPYIALVTLSLCSGFSSEAFQKGGRKGAKKVMIVITDGESHDSPDLEKVIQQSERDNVTRYAVAVSPAPCVPPCSPRGFAIKPLGTPWVIFLGSGQAVQALQ